MAHAIRVHEIGGPEKLKWESVGDPAHPAATEVLIRNRAVGLNFIDVYYRNGVYKTPLPMTPGSEGAGVIEAVGAEVKHLKVGDRVAYADGLGSYAEFSVKAAAKVLQIPDGIDERVAAASLLKGMTAEYLLRRTYKVKAGETILVHAAAGGVGQILCQWAKHLGARVIGTVSTEAKLQIAKAAGCEEVILTSREKVSPRVRELTGGIGVPVVYDGNGNDTFLDSLDCLKPRGLMVSFGNASGPVSQFALGVLSQKGSLYVTRPTLASYTSTRAELEACANALFEVIQSSAVKITVNQTYALANASQAHADLEARKTSGSTLLTLEG